MDMEELLTVKQAAILLKVHHLTVRRYINEGRLKALKVGGNVRISQSDLRDFSQSYLTNSKASKPSPTHASESASFSVNDPLFRLKGRGLSIDNVK